MRNTYFLKKYLSNTKLQRIQLLGANDIFYWYTMFEAQNMLEGLQKKKLINISVLGVKFLVEVGRAVLQSKTHTMLIVLTHT